MEQQFLRLEIIGRLPILFPLANTTWRTEADTLIITCIDTQLGHSMGYEQHTVYYVPNVNLKYFGPHVERSSRTVTVPQTV
jgi:hypothetical protein